jgi:hypothetical protein
VSVEALMPHSVTLLKRTPGAPDEYGDPIDDVVETATRAELQQVGTREEEGSALQVTTWRAFLPKDVPARGWDAIRLDSGALLGLPDGTIFELRGDPARVVNPRRAIGDHVEAYVEAVA